MPDIVTSVYRLGIKRHSPFFRKEGAVDLLEKPASDEALLACVRNALALDAKIREEEHRRSLSLKRVRRLTPREPDVMKLVVAGKLNKLIAKELQISIRTVEGHRFRVMENMQVNSLPDLIKLAQYAGVATI